MRLIDGEELKTAFHPGETVRTECVRATIDHMPAIEPRPRGKWIDEGFYADGHGAHAFRCSECGGHIIEYDEDPFCRWCGADMRQREEEKHDR